MVEPFPSVVWINKFKSWCRTRLVSGFMPAIFQWWHCFLELQEIRAPDRSLRADVVATNKIRMVRLTTQTDTKNTRNTELIHFCTMWRTYLSPTTDVPFLSRPLNGRPSPSDWASSPTSGDQWILLWRMPCMACHIRWTPTNCWLPPMRKWGSCRLEPGLEYCWSCVGDF